jgi:hypothetical protein
MSVDQSGAVLGNAYPNLPEEAIIMVNLVVQNVFNITMRNGLAGLRSR